MHRRLPSDCRTARYRRHAPGRLNRLERHLLDKPRQEARQGVQVKLLAEHGELHVFAQSLDRVAKERAMQRRQLKRLWKRHRQIDAMKVSREELLMKLVAARSRARRLAPISPTAIQDSSGSTISSSSPSERARKVRCRSLAHY